MTDPKAEKTVDPKPRPAAIQVMPQAEASVKKGGYVLSRLTGMTLSIYLLGAFASGILAYRVISNVMIGQNQDMLEAVLKSRATAVEEYYRHGQRQVAYLARNEMVARALEELSAGYRTIGDDLGFAGDLGSSEHSSLLKYYREVFQPRLAGTNASPRSAESYLPSTGVGRIAQWAYILNNPDEFGPASESRSKCSNSEYERAHRLYHPQLTRIMGAFDFYDIFLFDKEGNLVYTSLKEIDFGTNFYTGPHANSGLGRACRSVLASSSEDVVTVDFSNYEPSAFEPASFLASAVFDGDEQIGALAFQLDPERLNAVVSDLHGLGRSGETYIVGEDLLMRTDSRFLEDSSILRQTVNSPAAISVIRGQSGSVICDDYRGVEVLSQYRPLRISGLNWGILAEVDRADIMAPAKRLAGYTILILVFTILIIAFVSMTTLRLCVIRPLQQLLTGANEFRGGNYSTRIHIAASDEFAVLADSHNRMAQSIQGHIVKLETTLAEVKELKGLLPICSACKSIRDDDGYFKTVETYLVRQSNIQFSHTVCEDCIPLLYPELI